MAGKKNNGEEVRGAINTRKTCRKVVKYLNQMRKGLPKGW
jgi:hypothetical protein